MPVYKYPMPLASEITSHSDYLNRRTFLTGIAGATGLAMTPFLGEGSAHAALKAGKSEFSTDAKPTSRQDITTYNNFYEFGTSKSDPAANAGTLTTRPWTIEVDGMVNNPGTLDIDDLLTKFPLEERIYRFRCVEAWSMVIPWVGIPLSALLNKFDVQGSAKYVAFETLVRPEEMPQQRSLFPPLEWPYVEGLRLDEAMHPLTIMAVGLYGDILPNQNGAPARLVVPWKYGFKSIKSVVKMTLTESEPPTSWNKAAAREYGFYSNVNPQVDHPRWSQATERKIGAGLFASRVDTLMLNGYADQVGSLYSGMDLKKFY